MINQLPLYGSIVYALGMYTYIAVYLYKNRFTFFIEGIPWVRFWIGHMRGIIWPIFLIMYFINLFNKK